MRLIFKKLSNKLGNKYDNLTRYFKKGLKNE